MTSKPAPIKRAFSIKTFCAEYEIGKMTAYQAIRQGKLIARKLEKKTIIPLDEAEKFIAGLPTLQLPPAA